MGRRKLQRPSLGTVLGFTALIVAVVGTANASSSRTIIRKGDIAKGAVTANSLAPGAVHAKALAKGAVTAKALAGGAVGASALAPDSVTSNAIAPSAVYGGALGPVVVHTAPISDVDADPSNIEWTASALAVASCATGERLLTGGVTFTDTGNDEVAIVKSAPSESGWVGQITSNAGGTAKAEVQAVCLK
jgi:hypothetical protein